MTKRAHTDLKRQELYELVWSKPMHRLAAEFGVSDVALAKYCRRQQIPVPSRGYWARKAAGQDVGPDALPEFVPPDPPPAPVQRPTPTKVTACAIYVVGHGPRREPRLVELQLVRIHRYMDALAAKINEEFRPVETFVDLNWPRVNWWDPTAFPSCVRLLKAIADKTFDTVFIDLESGGPRNWAPYNSILPYLRHSGARVFNAHYDDEDALKNEISRKFGPRARESFFTGPDDASDIVAFFPALASAVALEAVDEDDRYDARWEPLLRDLRRLAARGVSHETAQVAAAGQSTSE